MEKALEMNYIDFLKIPGLGKKRVNEIIDALNEYRRSRESYEGLCKQDIDLRDKIASQALAGLLAAGRDAQWGDCMKSYAESAYEFADEMLRARKQINF